MKSITIVFAGIMMLLAVCTTSILIKESDQQMESTQQEILETTTLSESSAAETEVFDSETDIAEKLTCDIRVSFSENYLLDVVYYKNAEKTEIVEGDECYMKPGDCIYAGETKSVNTRNSIYFQSARFTPW